MTSAMAADLRPGDPATSAASPTLSTRVEKNYASDAEVRARARVRVRVSLP